MAASGDQPENHIHEDQLDNEPDERIDQEDLRICPARRPVIEGPEGGEQRAPGRIFTDGAEAPGIAEKLPVTAWFVHKPVVDDGGEIVVVEAILENVGPHQRQRHGEQADGEPVQYEIVSFLWGLVRFDGSIITALRLNGAIGHR